MNELLKDRALLFLASHFAFNSKMAVPVGFNQSVSVIKSDICLCLNPTSIRNRAAV